MAQSSGPLKRERPAVTDVGGGETTSTETVTARVGPMEFRPETFFLGRTEGAGVIRDPFGRIVRRCAVNTHGMFDPAHQAIYFDETFTYDDGETDLWRWVMSAARGGRYVAAEAQAGGGITGERRGGDYVISFRRPMGKARGLLAPHFSTRFTLLAPGLALKKSDITLLGAPVGTLTAVHRRIEN